MKLSMRYVVRNDSVIYIYMSVVRYAHRILFSFVPSQLYVEEEDYEALRKSIDSFQNFNMIALASKLATHELLEFRRISAYVYRCNKKWTQSIDLSKNEKNPPRAFVQRMLLEKLVKVRLRGCIVAVRDGIDADLKLGVDDP